MASGGDATSELSIHSLRTTLRSILVSSLPNGLTATEIEKDFQGFKNRRIPLFGFPSLDALLQSLSDVVMPKRGQNGQIRYYLVSDDTTKHLETLVKQTALFKQIKTNKVKVSRIGPTNQFSPSTTGKTPAQTEVKNRIVTVLTGKGWTNYNSFMQLYEESYSQKFDSQRLFQAKASVVFTQHLSDVVETRQNRDGVIYARLRQPAAPPRAFPARGTTPQLPYAMVAARSPAKFDLAGVNNYLTQPSPLAPTVKESQTLLVPPLMQKNAAPKLAASGPFQATPTPSTSTTSFGENAHSGGPFQQEVPTEHVWMSGRVPERTPSASGNNVVSVADGAFREARQGSSSRKSSTLNLVPKDGEKGSPTLANIKLQIMNILIDMYPEWVEVQGFSQVYKRYYGIDVHPAQYQKLTWKQFFAKELEGDFVCTTGFEGQMIRLSDQAAANRGLKINSLTSDNQTVKPKSQVTDIRANLISDLQRTLTAFPNGIPVRTLPARFLTATGKQLIPEQYGFLSLSHLLRTDFVCQAILTTPDGSLHLRETEENEGEEGKMRKAILSIRQELQTTPGSFLTLQSTKERFAEHGLRKEPYEIMHILWVQYKEYFKAGKVDGEEGLVTQLISDKFTAVSAQSAKPSPLRMLKWVEFPAWEGLNSLGQDAPERFVEVDVAQYVSLWEIWINLKENTVKVEDLMKDLDKFYGDQETAAKYKVPVEDIKEGLVCAAKITGVPWWHRAVVEKVSGDKTQVKLMYVDYGSVDVVSSEWMRHLDERFFSLPAQAILVSLPIDDAVMDQSAIRKVEHKVFDFLAPGEGQRLLAFGMRVLREKEKPLSTKVHQPVETEFVLDMKEGGVKYLISILQQEGLIPPPQELKEETPLDWDEGWEEEIEEELRAFDDAEFIPTDPDPQSFLKGLSPDSARLRLQILEIQKMRVARELTQPTSSGQNVNFIVNEFERLDREIKEMENLLSQTVKVKDYQE